MAALETKTGAVAEKFLKMSRRSFHENLNLCGRDRLHCRLIKAIYMYTTIIDSVIY